MATKTKKPTRTKKTRKKTPKYYWAVGRRKTATATVRLYEGKSKTTVNQKPIDQYFPGKINHKIYIEPFRTTNNVGKYYALIKVSGSGKKSQLGAVIHGLSRAFAKVSPDYKRILKNKDLLTRDDRMKERRKPGLAQSARAGKQSPKR